MAFFLTPRFAPAYSCSPSFCAPQRPVYRQQVSRPRQSFPSFGTFLSQVDDLLSDIDREARRAAHQQRQQRKRAFRARFDVRENKDGYQVEGEVPGFEQDNIEIEISDEHTLHIKGDTERGAQQAPAQTESVTAAALEEKAATEPEAENDTMDGVTLTEQAAPEVSRSGAATPDSDTSSHKSYQATVEDDFEDLGAETSSTISASSEPAAPKEPKGKEKAVEPEEHSTAVATQPQPEAPVQHHQQQQEPDTREWLNERVHGSFERTFKFPSRIDAANVRASLRNGVLSIQVPKAPVPEIRHITIQ